MRSQKINYFLVGSFVLAMLVAFVVATAMLTGRTGATDRYFAIYDNVTGVKFGTQVLYEGYPVGQVTRVAPIEGDARMRFRVDMDVIEGWRVPEDSVAQIAAPGLLSAVAISIAAGKSSTVLPPGGQIEGRAAADIFGAVLSIAGEFSDLAQRDIRPLLANLNRTVTSFGNVLDGDVPAFTAELLALTRDVARRVPPLAAKLDASADGLQAMLSRDNEKRVQAILGNVDAASRDFAGLAANLQRTHKTLDQLLATSHALVSDSKPDVQKTVADLRYSVDSIARHIDSINQDLESASRNMREFTEHIRQNPGLLLGGKPPTDAASR